MSKKIKIGILIYVIAFAISMALGIYFASIDTYAAEYTKDWLNGYAHYYNTDGNYLCAGGTGWDGKNPWYSCYCEGEGGVTIYDPSANNGNGKVYYIARENVTLKGYVHNNYNNWPQGNLPWNLSSSKNGDQVFSDWNQYFSDIPKVQYMDFNYCEMLNVDFTASSAAELYAALDAIGFDPSNMMPDVGDLPLLKYTFTSKQSIQGIKIPLTKINMKLMWNYASKEPYRSNPSAYTFEICGSANFTPYGVGEIFDSNNLAMNQSNLTYLTNGNSPISANEYSWWYEDLGSAIYKKSGKSFSGQGEASISLGYILYIRNKTTDNSKFSYWKIFQVVGGYLRSTNKVMLPDGTIVDASSIKDGNDGIDTGSGGNGGGGGWEPGGSTDGETDPTGDVYDDNSSINLSISNVINNLKALIKSISELPSMLQTLLSFLPDWFVTILLSSLALFVVIGLVKIIAR